MRRSAFQTGRTIDEMSRDDATAVVDCLFDDSDLYEFLIKVLTGEAEPRAIPEEFQSLAEKVRERIESVSFDDEGDARRKMEMEDSA